MGTDTSVVKYVERTIILVVAIIQSVLIRGSQVDQNGVATSGGSTPNASTIFGQGGEYFSASGGTAIL